MKMFALVGLRFKVDVRVVLLDLGVKCIITHPQNYFKDYFALFDGNHLRMYSLMRHCSGRLIDMMLLTIKV